VTAPVLEVEGLSVAYGTRHARQVVVSNVCVQLEAGKVVGLAGESGCGKSTLALASIGYRAPGASVHGHARLGDIDLLAIPLADRRRLWGARIAYVAQSSTMALNPAIPVGRQLAQVLTAHLKLRHAALRSRQVDLLEAVGLPDPERALILYPHQFSGGQQQRIAIAIALACNPHVLILDEPTTGLDVTTQARISALISTLVKRFRTATLYVSHDLSLLGSVADRLAVMYAGELVEHGPAAAVVRTPRHPYTQALISAAPTASERRGVTGILGSPPPAVVPDACAYAPRCPHAQPACTAAHIAMIELADTRHARCIRLDEVRAASAPVPELQTGDVSDRALLELDHVWCAYAKAPRPAVRGASFALLEGETLGIVGESGSGKSTLLRAIAGLHRPNRGAIRFAGAPLPPAATDRPRTERGRIQIIFQNPDGSLNPRHTVRQILLRSLRLFRPDVPRAAELEVMRELLDAVKLPRAVLHRYPANLSGGQKQRVAIARAFAARPALLLCDEITSALDVSVQATILELIADLSAAFSTSVVFVSHDLAVVRTIAARILVMKDGEICEAGATEQLFANPTHPYTQELLRSVLRVTTTPSTEPSPISP
jgi:peptide/nickel transport system ATP-binding protein